jgi:hypothetical protein
MTDHPYADGNDLARPDGYTRVWKVFWPNGTLKYQAHFVDGVAVGQQVAFWQDGSVAQVLWRDSNGCPRGTAVSFYPDGMKESEEVWDECDRHPGSYVCSNFDDNGDVYLRTTYHRFKQVNVWERPANDAEAAAEIDAIVDESVNNAIGGLLAALGQNKQGDTASRSSATKRKKKKR